MPPKALFLPGAKLMSKLSIRWQKKDGQKRGKAKRKDATERAENDNSALGC